MKIDASTVNMDSNRVYQGSSEIKTATVMTNLSTGQRTINATTFKSTYLEYSSMSGINLPAYDSYSKGVGVGDSSPLVSDLYSNYGNSKASMDPIRTRLEELHNSLIKQIEEFMERIRNQLASYKRLGFSDSESSVLDLTTGFNQPGSMFTRQEYLEMSYSETETTVFNGSGVVKTADGRTIDFNMSMEMSRAFMESVESVTESTEYILTDPLVIKLDDAPDTISDKTFFFDLDCDGIKEEMSALAGGNGFLALDENDNGIIDDGSELFGTKSGNGFADLAKYDEDGNGWIDENDSVYTRLKIWTKDAAGNDRLLNLTQADIGAIYLGAANTQFSINDAETNATKAMVRQTGMFLHESSGLAGAIQQIDFATRKPA